MKKNKDFFLTLPLLILEEKRWTKFCGSRQSTDADNGQGEDVHSNGDEVRADKHDGLV